MFVIFAVMRCLLLLAVLFLALHGCAAEGEADEGSSAAAPAAEEAEPEAPMEEKQKRALYASIESFVGKGWNGSGLFPDPCGQTSIQVRLRQSSFVFLPPQVQFLIFM